MSEGDVSLIHDEDLLRRMWQQTEDFSRKKEIRAHMYRLRELRLRTMHAHTHHLGKSEAGREGHMQSFADDSFQRLKHKEVRDAASPTRSLAPDGADSWSPGDASPRLHLAAAELATTDQHTRLETSSSEQRQTLHSHTYNSAVSSRKTTSTEYDVHENRQSNERNEEHRTGNGNIDEVHRREEQTRVETSSTASRDCSDRRETPSSWKRNDTVSSQKFTEEHDIHGNRQSAERIVDQRTDRNVEEDRREQRTRVEKYLTTSGETSKRDEMRKINNTVSSQKLTTDFDMCENRQSTERNVDHYRIDKTVDQVDHCESASVQSEDVQLKEKSNQFVDDRKLPEVQEGLIEKTFTNEYHKGANDKEMTEAKEEVIEKKEAYTTSDQYRTTYQEHYPQRSRISQELSPSHQAWASSLRGDSPPRAARADHGRCSSTHSTYSIAESRSDITARCSPDRRTPGPRKTPDRSSKSPEKLSHNGISRFSASPERKPKTVPSKSSISPDRPRASPEKISRASPERKYPTFDRRSLSPTKPYEPAARPSLSPERNPSRPASILIDSLEGALTPTRSSVSPDRKPGYMKPTVASSPTKPHAKSPERNIFDTTTKTTTKIKEDHYKFVDEETKVYKRIDQDNSTYNTKYSTINKNKSPSPSRNASSVRAESPATNKSSLRQESRSPSPPKGPVTFTSDTIDETITTQAIKNKTYINHYDDSTSKFEKHTDTSIKKNTTQKTSLPPKEETIKSTDTSPMKARTPSRESSPTKYGTYEKKHSKDSEDFTTATKEIKHDYITRYEENVPTSKNISDTIVTKTPRSSVSPTKSSKAPSKEKYRNTTDFISTERQTEETNKKNTVKERPRQLVTPSTSPTRKPKVETAPSTGQSSPTTSVSGFIYFGSPQTEIVTDLDDHYTNCYENIKSDETTTISSTEKIERSHSPTKIPCRSPSPQRRVSPIKENLPRKSSLKKPSIDSASVTPIEKPPTTFIVSPTEENKNISQHKIVKKDRAESAVVDSPIKPKPPFERRETYEERCKKILGMVDDTKNNNSGNSPRSSPGPKESSPTKDKTNIDKSTFQKEVKITTSTDKTIDTISKPKTLSRESSPTKLEDITHSTSYLSSTIEDKIVIESSNNSKNLRPKQLFSPNHSPDRKTSSHIHDIVLSSPVNKSHKFEDSRQSPERKPSQKRSSLSPVKLDKTTTVCTLTNTNQQKYTTDDNETVTESKYSSARSSLSPDRKNTKSGIPLKHIDQLKSRTPSPTKKMSETTKSEVKQTVGSNIKKNIPSRTPSPSKKVDEIVKEIVPSRERTPSPVKKISQSADFLASEREQQVLEKVQKSLRKLSPSREENTSTSRDKSPCKTTISLQNLDEVEVCMKETEDIKTTLKNTITTKNDIQITNTKNEKSNATSKLPSRNVSPTKKPSPLSSPKTEKKPETHTKSRSISPKKPYNSPLERPQSPHVSKISGSKPKEPSSSLTRSLTPRTTSPKRDKTTVVDINKSVTKQNSATSLSKSITTKSTVISKTETDIKKSVTTRGVNKENVSPKKEPVTRTTSDLSVRSKKPSPQRMKSKPEIQVSDTSKSSTSSDYKKKPKEPQTKLASKPKSATSLNTSIDEDDIIIDVQQAKSSRENSPDRICPTPIGFTEDVSTPRYPDEVKEPDDEFQRRTNHIIHETESIVDDIVEISEDDELFVKRSDFQVEDADDCLLSVTDKVSKFTNKMTSVEKPKDTSTQFKDAEKREHSDFVEEQLKSDECLLSVTEKVNKFAKGQMDKTDSQNKTRNVVDEYDVNTVYQDDYTKLSVNDKAHLFVETAEKAKVAKVKSPQKVERPDLTVIDECLKSDTCLLSVSDKVNKFVKTAEDFLSETRINEEKERKIKEQHDLLMKRIADSAEVETKENIQSPQIGRSSADRDDAKDSFAKETTSSHAKFKNYKSPNLKTGERPASVKITTLRSSEAVKKAKALFENIATTQKETSKTTKLTDIGVIRAPRKDITNGQLSEEERAMTPHLESESPAPSRRRSSPPRPHQDTPRPPSPAKSATPASPASPRPTAGYMRATATSQLREEKPPEEAGAPRGSGKFGVELRPAQRPAASAPAAIAAPSAAAAPAAPSDRRRSEPCIEDIHDIVLLEQMLEQVVGYEQRRRIRAQLRVARRDRAAPARPAPRSPSPRKATSPAAPAAPAAPADPLVNGHAKEMITHVSSKKTRTRSPEKAVPKKTASPSRQPSPDKKIQTRSPNETSSSPKLKSSRFSEYATAYMKKVGLAEANTTASSNLKTSKTIEEKSSGVQEVRTEAGRSPSPRRRPAAPRAAPAPAPARAPAPAPARAPAPAPARAPAPAPARAPASPADAVISSYGPGPLDEQGRPLFGIKALRNSSNYRVRGTVVRSEYSSRDGAAAAGVVTIAAYSNERAATSPRLLQGLAAISTTRKFGGGTGLTLNDVYTKEDRASLEQFTHSESRHTVIDDVTSPRSCDVTGARRDDVTAPAARGLTITEVVEKRAPSLDKERRSHSFDKKRTAEETRTKTEIVDKKAERRESSERRVESTREERKTVRQSSVKSLTEKYIKSASETTKSDRSAYPKAGLILRASAPSAAPSSPSARKDSSQDASQQGVQQSSSSRTHTQVRGDVTRHVTGSDVMRHVTSGDVTRHVTGGDVTRHMSGSDVTRHVTGSDVTRHMTGSDVTRHVTSGDVTRHVTGGDVTRHVTSGDVTRHVTGGDVTRHVTSGDVTRHVTGGDVTRHVTSGDVTRHVTGGDVTRHVTSGDVTRHVTGGDVTRHETSSHASFLDSSTKVTGVQDILTRMRNADIGAAEGAEGAGGAEEREARALLNKFVGATVLMAGMRAYVDPPRTHRQGTVPSNGTSKVTSTRTEHIDLDQCWDERILNTLLEQCDDYEQRRRIRARIRALMAEQEACATAVTEALGDEHAEAESRETEETRTTTTSIRNNSVERSTATTETSRVIESVTRPAPKVSPFAKFRQLEKQNSLNSPSAEKAAPLFRFTEPGLALSALTIKERLLQWCRDKTRDYENVKLENFSSSWADGLAFCALLHHFLPDAFDYHALTPAARRHNFHLAFTTAHEKADIYPLLDVEDMVAMRRPDWKCVFTYVQAIHRRFKDQP